jgi:YD repeat-containing protein
MKRIATTAKPVITPTETQRFTANSSARYWDGVSGHETSGAFVSELTVGAANPVNHNVRTEKRGDNVTRTFTYNGAGFVTWATDFMSHSSTYGYDSYKYRNAFIDFNRNETDYTCDPITGNITQIKFPLTPGDTPGQGNTRPTVNYTYTNSYYLHTVQDEGSHTTNFTRDNNNRVTRIDYPDGGYETFAYDAGHFYQPSTHRMTAGGTETFAYDGSSRLQFYSDPYHSNPGNPSIQYFYAGHGWVDGILDALGHPTNFDYNDRGQVLVTTLATDPVDNQRHTITNVYNPDGTLQRKTDQLGHVTSYIYDEYRRLKSVTPPVRGYGDNGTYTTNLYYDASGTGDDYRYTDSNATYIKRPSAKKTKTVYDDNRRKSSVTVGYGSGDDATTSYLYDGMGNVTWLTNLRGFNTHTIYDERNRPSEVHDPLGNITSFTYDTAGRRKTINRPNGQVITNASFDEMNRVLQQNVTQTPDPLAVTKYTYYPSGLLNTITDPRNSTDSYTYVYDLTGRKQNVTYPANLNGNHWTEHFTYDAAGRLDTFKNRKGNVKTFHYDGLNRLTYFTWDDNLTPRVDFSYDVASRLTEIDNVNATITRAYFNDNLLRTETEVITGGRSKQVAYTYNADGGRATITYPDYQAFAYTPTGRNQVRTVGPWATYTYDENSYTGDLTTRTLNNGTQSTYLYDPLDRVTWNHARAQ